MVIRAGRVGPGLVVTRGHVNLMEPNSEPLNGGYTVNADILCLQLPLTEIILQRWQLCLHNWWQHWCTHAQRGICGGEVKLGDGETQYIGEVYQLLRNFVGEELFEVIIDPLGRGSVLIQGHLENGLHIGHPFGFTFQWKGEV